MTVAASPAVDAELAKHADAMVGFRRVAERWRSKQVPLIAIVDDDRATLLAHGSVLRQIPGVEVVCLDDVDDALKLARERPVRLWVLDLHMPKMSGMELAQSIRESSRVPLAPILVVSGVDPEIAKELSVEMGANVAALPKPVEVDDLLAAARRALHLPPG